MCQSRVSYALTENTLRQLDANLPGKGEKRSELLESLKKVAEDSHVGFSGKGCCFHPRADFRRMIEECGGDADLICRYAEPALIHPIPEGQEDFTCYFDRSGKDDEIEQVLKYYQGTIPAPHASKYSYECKLRIWDKGQRKVLFGRALACPCREGKKWSVTIRKDWAETQQGHRPTSIAANSVVKPAAKPEVKKESAFLNEIAELGDLLYDLIFELGEGKEQGLVIVAGRTAAGKSKIVRHLLGRYLQERIRRTSSLPTKKPRKPHVLTYEEPIEKYFDEADKELIKEIIEETDYTPRQVGLDVGQLEEVLNDALRQTPAVLFVGETRKLEDWKALLHFAGTGHLIVTTTHAGSLTEAMGNVLRAAKSLQPRARSVVADRLSGVVHLRGYKEKGKSAEQVVVEKNVLLPTLWRYTPNGAKSLMAEGLASLLPNLPDQLPPGKRSAAKIRQFPSSIGRYWFARELTELARTTAVERRPSGCKREQLMERQRKRGFELLLTNVARKAFEWDLEGI